MGRTEFGRETSSLTKQEVIKMATIANDVSVAEKPILNKAWLCSAFAIYAVFYAWVRYYEGVYGELTAA